MERLANSLRRHSELPERDIASVAALLDSKPIRRGETVTAPGKVDDTLYFVESGLLRVYYIDEKGRERILKFVVEGWWHVNYDSLLHGVPAGYYVQCLEDTNLLTAHRQVLNRVQRAYPLFDRFLTRLAQKTTVALEKRVRYFLELSSEGRYTQFVKMHPAFVQRIPQYMLASYLDISPEHLSTLRNRLANGPPRGAPRVEPSDRPSGS